MKGLFVLLAAAFALPACGGKASMDHEFGVSFHRVWQAQANSTVKKRPLPMTSEDARVVIGNHQANFAKKRAGGGGSMGSTVSGSGGSLAPMTASLESGGGGESSHGASKIKLKAK